MKIIVKKEALKGVLDAALKAASPNAPLPVLSHVLLTARDGRLTVAASNLERAVIAETAAVVETEGAFTVPAKPFCDIVSLAAAKSDVVLERNAPKGQCSILADGSECSLVTLEADEFPVLPSIESCEWKLTTTQGALVRELKATSFAMASTMEGTRAVLNGLSLSLKPVSNLNGGVLKDGDTPIYVFKATDARKLSIMISEGICNSFEGKWDPAEKKGIVIPKPTIDELIKLFKPCSDFVEFGEAGSFFFVRSNGVTMISRLVEGNYPDLDKVVSASGGGYYAVMDRESLVRAVKTALVFSKDINAPDLVRLKFDEASLSVAGKTGNVGSGCKTISCEYSPTPPGENESEVALNGKYLLEVLAAISQDEDKVTMEFRGKESPFMIRGFNDTAMEHVTLVMPMRLE